MSSGKFDKQRIVFDDSSDSDRDGDDHGSSGGDTLAREMAAAAERERRKNPHAESGRATRPRAHPLAPAKPANASSNTSASSVKTKKVDLFGSDSSSEEEEEGGKDEEGVKMTAKGKPRAEKVAASANKVAHVQGLSIRPVDIKKKKTIAATTSDASSEDEGEGLHINNAFATRYEEKKRKQELNSLAEKYKGQLGRAAAAAVDDELSGGEEDLDEEEEEEEDDEAVLLTKENRLSFAKALLAVRRATVPLTAQKRKKQGTAESGKEKEKDREEEDDNSASAAPALLPKEVLLQDRFFPPVEAQIKANTELFERYVEHRRHGDGNGKFTLSDEYARAVRATAVSEDAVVDDDKVTAPDGGARDGLRKLRPQTSEDVKLRAAFLRDAADSADTFEVVRGSRSNETGSTTEKESGGLEGVGEDNVEEEERRLLEEAFAIGVSKLKKTKKSKPKKDGGGAEAEVEEEEAQAPEDPDVFLRDFFIQELWRPGAKAKKNKNKKVADGGEAQVGANSSSADDEEEDEEGQEGNELYYKRLEQLAREEEDAFFHDAEVWEHEFQEKKYRHQEAEDAAAQVQTFPRPIGEAATGLLRKPDTSRKDARQRRRERAEAARAQQLEELKRLKHLKRQEIEDQRALIASVAGLAVASGTGCGRSTRDRHRGGAMDEEAELAKLKAVWSDKDLDAPFDPAEFDKKMALLFNDEYYDASKVDEDEIAYFDEELDRVGEEGEGMGDNVEELRAGAAPALFAANSLEEAQAMVPREAGGKKRKKTKGNAANEPSERFFDDAFGPLDSVGGGADGDDATNADTDALSVLYPSEALQALEKERQHVKELQASVASKEGGGDEGHAELVERLQASLKAKEEEYFQLHRDAVTDGTGSGATPMPFRYREVEAEDFTLSIEEILALDDRQLNMIAPMNCYASYLDKESNERDRRRIERRRQKGFRELDSDRASRRYGDVSSTAVLNLAEMDEEAGRAVAAQLSKRLREQGEVPLTEQDLDATASVPTFHRDGSGGDRGGRGGRGRGNGLKFQRSESSDRGGRGIRGGVSSPPFRGRGGSDRGGFQHSPRGGRGRGRGHY